MRTQKEWILLCCYLHFKIGSVGSKAYQTEKQSYFRKYESMNIMRLFPKIKMNTNELMNNLYNLKKNLTGFFLNVLDFLLRFIVISLMLWKLRWCKIFFDHDNLYIVLRAVVCNWLHNYLKYLIENLKRIQDLIIPT